MLYKGRKATATNFHRSHNLQRITAIFCGRFSQIFSCFTVYGYIVHPTDEEIYKGIYAKEFQNLENDWEFEENLVNFTIDPFFQADADPVNFAPQTWVTSDVDGFVPSWTVSPAEVDLDVPFSTMSSAADSSLEKNDFSETVQSISQVLMEENLGHKQSMFYDPFSLQVTEKSFYDALKENHTSSPSQRPLYIYENVERPDVDGSDSNASNSNNSINIPWHGKPHNPKPSSLGTPISADYSFKSNLQSNSPKPCQPPNASLSDIDDGVIGIGSFSNEFLAQKIFNNAESVLQFRRGLEEASKFLPKCTQLTTGMESNMSLELKKKIEKEVIKVDEDFRQDSHGLKGRKNPDREDIDEEEERSNKQSAVYDDESDLSDMFDQVLLTVENVPLCAQQEGPQNGSIKVMQPIEQPNSSDGGKSRPKKKGKKKETVDLRTLLVLCAQAVSSNDNRTANELLKQIRRHSSPFGDAAQRLAHYFANGLQARLVGAATGTQLVYTALMSKRFSATDILKAYHAIFSVCPFKKFAHFFTYKMILEASEEAESLHIIDFGISYGFHWPMLIKFLSQRTRGPPKLRITGIEYPQTGFRPAERIEETGRRLANYCKRFNVPFEYKAIASKNWETIKVEEFNIDSNDLLAVNCLMRFKNLLDDTIEVNNPRNAVLSLIRKMNPDIFVQSVVNGAYNAPFFVTRFRESLFHFSAMYDMFDTLLTRENEWRLMSEKEFLGREALNVIACEGSERVERPETYKQWQVRNTRIGFRQLPLTKELVSKFQEKLKAWYHRDFVINEDNNWMLQGWKGRILYASTCWVPA
ncbi:hypothetical protein L6164_028460 [Bauhinia variegata]|uniref:Uncharacterized protein n=1 Tax=Bauhinia variegata TaxID=167791 RepID=A0ACB9L6L2_BAUVA|nr:hypothetical protein L6164_028460 [Bauhinia variegata]